MPADARYIPALGQRWLTGLYDPVVRWATRERTFKAALLDTAAIQPGERVLDLGCGTGTLTIGAALRSPAATVVGIDGDADVLDRARRKAAKAGAAITLDQGLVDHLPYEAESFDVVVSSLVFHHLSLDCKRAALAEVLRVLTPGGRLCLADWSKPQNLVMRAAFLSVQLLDGFATTQDHVRGAMPRLIANSGFDGVAQVHQFSTLSGTLAVWRAEKPHTASGEDLPPQRDFRPPKLFLA